MITVKKDKVWNVKDIIRRSSVANVPGAERILSECMHRSVEVWYGAVDGEVACAWGLIPPTLLSDNAYLWLITTELVDAHKFLFVRWSQRYIEEALKIYPIIIGDVIVGNDKAKRWLEWLGAKFYPREGKKIPFVIKKTLHG